MSSATIIPFAALQVIKACRELERLAEQSDQSSIDATLSRVREARSDDVEWMRPSDTCGEAG